jgi:hypothetical protein
MNDYDFDPGPVVVMVNRSSQPLELRFNGRTLVFPPGVNYTNERYAQLARRKFFVMGTEDPQQPGKAELLVGVEAWGDPITPQEQSEAVEVMDRSKIPDGYKGRTLVGTRGLVPGAEAFGRNPLPDDGIWQIDS